MTLLAALVTGCIPLPVPVPDMNPRYSTAQLDVVGREATTATSIRAELQTNPFLRWDAPAVRAAAASRLGRVPADALETFAAIREWKNRF